MVCDWPVIKNEFSGKWRFVRTFAQSNLNRKVSEYRDVIVYLPQSVVFTRLAVICVSVYFVHERRCIMCACFFQL